LESKEAASAVNERVEAKRARWLAENREAFDSTNREFERRGLLLADLPAESDYSQPRSDKEQDWLDVPRAGKRFL
jgi:hypothetical protein